jgi:hypothetical protein
MACLTNDISRLWPDGIIPYKINSKDFPEDSTQRDLIHQAINEINTKTNLWLKPRQAGEASYVSFESSAESCSSLVGMDGGKQSLACAIGDKFGFGSVVHEIMHVAGFYHEHQRPDRDEWIFIDMANVKSVYDFRGYNESECKTVNKYNYASILHYPSDILNPYMVYDTSKKTILPLKPLDTETILGQRGALSKIDIESINAIYTKIHANKGELLPTKVSIWWVLAGTLFIFFLLIIFRRR